MDPELSKALLQKRIDAILLQFGVTDSEFVAYVLPRVPASRLFDADVMQREIRRFAVEMRRVH